jgi:hypothetical protein
MCRNLVKAFNPGDLYIFTSPWALNYQDEVSQRRVLSLFSVIKNFQLNTIYAAAQKLYVV